MLDGGVNAVSFTSAPAAASMLSRNPAGADVVAAPLGTHPSEADRLAGLDGADVMLRSA